MFTSGFETVAHWSEEFIVQFAELCRSVECIWKVKSKRLQRPSEEISSLRSVGHQVETMNKDAYRDRVAK